MQDRPIPLFNHGRMQRGFTYVDDLVDAIRALMDVIPRHPAIPVAGDRLSPVAPWRVVNIGNGAPKSLTAFIDALQVATGRTARLQMLPMQPRDVVATWADTGLLGRLTGPRAITPLEVGLARYVKWFIRYHGAYTAALKPVSRHAA